MQIRVGRDSIPQCNDKHCTSHREGAAPRACIPPIPEANRCLGTFWPGQEPDMRISFATEFTRTAYAEIGVEI